MSYQPRARRGTSGTPINTPQMLPPQGYKQGYLPGQYAHAGAAAYAQSPHMQSAQLQAQVQAQAQAQAHALAQMQGTPSRPGVPSHASHGSQGYRAQPAPAPPRQVAFHPETYPAGPLGYFLPPPGQRSLLDPTLSTPPVTQAFYTTYPSRLRTGVTALVQPENVTGGPREREAQLAEQERELAGARSSGTNTPRIESPAPSRPGRTTTTTFSGRRAGRVNYAEADESEDEDPSSEEEIEEAPSDPDDETFGERRRRRDPYAEKEYQNRVVKIKRKHTEVQQGWTWLGDRAPAERVKSEIAKVTKHRPYPEEVLEREAERLEMLVPITVDYDIPSPTGDNNGLKIKDRFLWNAADPLLKPLEFATILCDDLGVPTNPHANTIADLISAQIDEAQAAAFVDLQTPDATPDEVMWSDDESVDEREDDYTEPDCRIIVNLDVQIFSHVLRDRIEWDLSSPLPPAEFARHYCAELGLTGEAIPLVAHAIHEELLKHKRDALELDLFTQSHPMEQAKWEKTAGQQPRTTNRYGARRLAGVWRDWWEREEFSPVLIELSTEEMERREQERGREARRMMRTLNTSKRRR